MTNKIQRRRFLQSTALTGAFGFGLFPSPGLSRERSPSSKLNIAQIGVGSQGGFHLSEAVGENQFALCDVDSTILAGVAESLPDAKTFADWREMIDTIGDQIDGIIIATPDHQHAQPAIAAMKRGIHCYCEKPLAHDVWQIRQMQKIAREKNLKTQMGTQVHSWDNYRRVVEKIQAGAIGTVKEVHVRVGTIWGGIPATQLEVECPKSLNWDLWIGPAPMRPFQPCYLGGNWRAFWDFGNGGMGDMGCHWLDLPFWALGLKYPKTIEAFCEHAPDADFAPRDLSVRYEFDYAGSSLLLHWYDGEYWHDVEAVNPPIFAEHGYTATGSVTLFIGSDGVLWSTYGEHGLLPEEKFTNYTSPTPTIPPSIGHHAEWFEAIRNNGETTCNFDYSGTMAETVLLGPTAYRCGEKLFYDAEAMKAINCPAADAILKQPYREGWSL